MVNVPLIADRLALRLVGFTAEDAGFIDNVLSDSPRRRLFPGKARSQRGPGRRRRQFRADERRAGRAALGRHRRRRRDAGCAVPGPEHRRARRRQPRGRRSEPGPVRGREPRRQVVPARADAQRVAVVRRPGALGLVLRPGFSLRGGCHRLRVQLQSELLNCVPMRTTTALGYDFGGDPRGFATNDEQTEITTFEARLQSPSDSESRWAWLVGAFYSEEKEHTEFDSFVRGYADTPSFTYFQYYNTPTTATARADRPLVPRPLRHRARPGRGVRRAVSYDLTENFTITAGARWFDYDRKFVQHPGAARRVQRVFPAGRQPGVERGRQRRQAEPDLPLRRRPPRLRDVLGRVPRRRQQPAEAAVGAAPRLFVRRAQELRGRPQVGVARQPPAVQHRRVLHEVGRLRGADRGPAGRAFSSSVSSTCPIGRDPGRRGRVCLQR